MARYRMSVIPEPAPNTRTVLAHTGARGYAMAGDGTRDYACGACRRTLLRRVEPAALMNLVFRCRFCGAYNEIPRAHQTH